MTRTGLVAVWLLVTAAAWGFPLPPPLETSHLVGKGLPSGAPPVPLEDQFWALGWSAEGAFAALERRSGLGSAPDVRLRVWDLVEDTVLYEQEWTGWGDGSRDAWWAQKAPVVDQVFSRFQLVPTDWQLGVFPLVLGEQYYTLTLRTRRSADAPWIERLQGVVNATGRGFKAFLDKQGYWRWAAVVGFVPSPLEDRVALLLLVQSAGWLGERQPVRFLVAGLSLKAGFTKP